MGLPQYRDIGVYGEEGITFRKKRVMLPLRETAGISLADVLRVGLKKAKPVAGIAWDQGYEAALADCHAAVCRTCQDRVIELLPEGG